MIRDLAKMTWEAILSIPAFLVEWLEVVARELRGEEEDR